MRPAPADRSQAVAGYWCMTNVAGLTRQLAEEQVVAGASS
jgi:hypothetical protein